MLSALLFALACAGDPVDTGPTERGLDDTGDPAGPDDTDVDDTDSSADDTNNTDDTGQDETGDTSWGDDTGTSEANRWSGEVALSAEARRISGVSSGDGAGAGIGAASDVDRDGVADLLIGAPDASGGQGAVYLVRGPVTADLSLADADAILTGSNLGEQVGSAAAVAGDFDGDGLNDLLVGGVGLNGGAGGAFVVPGTWRGEGAIADAALLSMAGESGGDSAGYSLAGGVDLTGDGAHDAVVTAHTLGTSDGRVYVIAGPASGAMSLADATRLDGPSTSQAGREVSVDGDLDGDGARDLLVGGRRDDGASQDAGAAWLVLGPIAGDLDLASADATWTGAERGSHAGRSVSAGDTDGDGYDDALIGGHIDDNGTRGAAWLVRGGAIADRSLLDADAALLGVAERFDDVGWAVSIAGDLDNDENADLLLGAWQDASGGDQAGAGFLVYGPISGGIDLTTDADARLIGGAGDQTGYRATGVADADNDGRIDLLLGAPGMDGAGGAWLIPGVDR